MKIFISYPSEQLAVARSVYEFCLSLGLSTWFDKESIVGGQDWEAERQQAQEAADVTLLLFDAIVLQRPGVIQREIRQALARQSDMPFGHIHLVPMRISDTPVPAHLSNLHWIDQFRDDWRVRLCRAFDLKITQSEYPENETIKNIIQSSGAGEPSVATLSATVLGGNLEAAFIAYPFDSDYWSYVNAEIKSLVFRSYYEHKWQMSTWSDGKPHNSDWYMGASEHFRRGEVISISLGYSYYYEGTAHPSHGVKTLAFGGHNVGKLRIENILTTGENTRTYLCGKIQDCVRSQLGEPLEGDEYFDFKHYTEVYDWRAFSSFTFDEIGINFELSEVLPHVMGGIEAKITWGDLREYLQPELRGTNLWEVIEKYNGGDLALGKSDC